ncbi:MAG: hypothetical protein JWO99_578 [Candidatus Saccharibacteria bacterium]|nr:hypothetical protein [Candidatus Saccharibacteria bacterium]
MPVPHGEISFKPTSLLRVDGEIIEAETISASELHDFVIASTDTISSYVESFHRHNLLKAHKPELKERMVIHTARLALHEFDRSVITALNQQDVDTINTSPRILTPEAREYWDAVAATSFQPEIHIRGVRALEGTSGVWLSLKTPK